MNYTFSYAAHDGYGILYFNTLITGLVWLERNKVHVAIAYGARLLKIYFYQVSIVVFALFSLSLDIFYHLYIKYGTHIETFCDVMRFYSLWK